jgi:predicted secreted hydrolase
MSGIGCSPAILAVAAHITRRHAARAKPVKHLSYFSTLIVGLLILISACDKADTATRQSDFAVLAQQVDGYTEARPGRILSFPADHGPHPDYRIEWWYLTANLSAPENESYGVQWTLFRVAINPTTPQEAENQSSGEQLFMAHVGITTPTEHLSFQRYAHGGEDNQFSRAGVIAVPFSAWLDDWVIESSGHDWLPMEVRAKQDNQGFHLKLRSDMPPILQGDAGFSQKHIDGGGSHYYSQPFLKASGELTLNGKIIPVSGNAWLDREWGSQFLQADQVGWDWFSLHLDNGEKLMLFQLRQQAGKHSTENFIHGSLIHSDGTSTPLDQQQIQLEVLDETRVNDRSLPLKWQIRLPQIGRQLNIEALHPEQWMDVDFPYWEGVVRVNGSGPENSGRGYMELTGYAKPTGKVD